VPPAGTDGRRQGARRGEGRAAQPDELIHPRPAVDRRAAGCGGLCRLL